MMCRIRTALLLLAAALVAAPDLAIAQGRMKVLLDTDIGTDIDDAWALGYALKSPTFDLLGVTVTDADTPQRARLACKLLYRLGRTDVPVAVGRQTPAVPPDRVDYQFTWAEDFRELQAGQHAGGRIPGGYHPQAIPGRSRSSRSGRCRTSATSCACTPTSCRS